jgi:hypothetical protein
MTELHALYQNARQETQDFLNRIIPLVLKGAKTKPYRQMRLVELVERLQEERPASAHERDTEDVCPGEANSQER